ncbi:MAG TPA: RsmE family RNA methyltransferase [Acidimicrobiia bacterium]|jgi:16S rRNA (uracil1498-N3)-methyltransferase
MVDPPASFPARVVATAHVFADRLDDRIAVGGDDGHHLQRARRVRAGEHVTVADGYGRWREYAVVGSDAGVVDLDAVTLVTHEPPLAPRLTVACSLTKGQKPELAVQKLTELGVDRIMLVDAARSVVHWDDAKVSSAFTRLERVAREAAMQSRRARIPVVDGPVAPAELARFAGLVVAAPDGVGAADLPLPAGGPGGEGGEWVVAVGPEGGFDEAELRAFGTAPRLAVGPFVLRAETAAIAAAAALAGQRGISSERADRREW